MRWSIQQSAHLESISITARRMRMLAGSIPQSSKPSSSSMTTPKGHVREPEEPARWQCWLCGKAVPSTGLYGPADPLTPSATLGWLDHGTTRSHFAWSMDDSRQPDISERAPAGVAEEPRPQSPNLLEGFQVLRQVVKRQQQGLRVDEELIGSAWRHGAQPGEHGMTDSSASGWATHASHVDEPSFPHHDLGWGFTPYCQPMGCQAAWARTGPFPFGWPRGSGFCQESLLTSADLRSRRSATPPWGRLWLDIRRSPYP